MLEDEEEIESVILQSHLQTILKIDSSSIVSLFCVVDKAPLGIVTLVIVQPFGSRREVWQYKSENISN